jgi:ribosomal protein L3 glutamine methyltransferase
MDKLFAEAQTSLSSLRDLLRFAVSRFDEAELAYGHGTTNAWDEAAYLTLWALKIPLSHLEVCLDARLVPSEIQRVLALLEKRIKDRVPSPYLTHEAFLGDYKFYVDERVIVPRSFIAELLHEHLAPWVEDPTQVKTALDLCTGSGCLATLMALTFSYAQVDAIDISKPALEVATRNINDYGLADQVRLIESDLFEKVKGERYDLIVSNPPYVNAQSMQTLPEEYLHEPRLALAAGDDGLDIVRRIIEEGADHLTPKGLLVVEIGHNRLALEEAYPDLPFTWLDTSGGDEHVFLLTRAQLDEWKKSKAG